MENEAHYIKTILIIESIFYSKLYKLFIYKKQQSMKIIIYKYRYISCNIMYFVKLSIYSDII